jgi:hypothetical protein
MAGPRQVIDGPDFTPLPYGLWDSVQKPSANGPHWQNGITWSGRCGGGGTLYDECLAVTGTGGSPTGQAAMSSNVIQTNRGATSFSVYAEFDCSPIGNRSFGDVQAEAEAALLRVEQWQVERAFWTGTAGATASGAVPQTTVFPHLAAVAPLSDSAGILLQSAASVAVTGSGDDVAWMLGQLENSLGDCYHGRGFIHVPQDALPTFAAWDLVEEGDDGLLHTPAGNILVVGAGYPGTGPDGAAAPAGTAWIYATGAVFGFRGEVLRQDVRDSFDRTENTVRAIAQRPYVLGFECCHLAARVSLGVPL